MSQFLLISILLELVLMLGTNRDSSGVRSVYLCDTAFSFHHQHGFISSSLFHIHLSIAFFSQIFSS
jgi:hypothetical protein